MTGKGDKPEPMTRPERILLYVAIAVLAIAAIVLMTTTGAWNVRG